MSSEAILRFENISKNINRTEILKNINFEVERGEVVGIIGKNGSGKTTLLKLASGLSYPTKGEIYFFDKKLEPGFVGRLPQNIGVLIETPSFISNLSGFDNLYYLSKIRNIISKDDITETIEKVGLDSNNKNPFKTYSLGMKQRLALGVALLGEPEFLILDEPVNGLDPTGIIELRELLKKLVKEREVTILISSHILSELHQLATCYGFLHKGELLKQISAEELNEECKRHICLRTDNIQKTTLLLEQKGNINNYSVYPDNSIRIYECLDNVRMISKLLSSNGVIIDEISVQGENLETYFENLIGGRKNV